MDSKKYSRYLSILEEELIPALGCTEPIAIAYAAAKAKDILGAFPETITVRCSGNIIKNVKSVVVPTTGDMTGIDTSAILGAVGGDASLGLEVLSKVVPADVEQTRKLREQGMCKVELIENVPNLMIEIRMERGEDTAIVEIRDAHTNVVRIEKNGTLLLDKREEGGCGSSVDRSAMNLDDIYAFVQEVVVSDVKALLDRQVECNMAIAKEGLANRYGVNVGACLLDTFGDDVKVRARALPAAGSDARMNGCNLPVVINSGSGNQGLTVSLPLVAFAEEMQVGEDRFYRALVLSNLVAIYQKNQLGKLSAYCGAVSAAAGTSAGIAYLQGHGFDVVSDAIVNTLANVSGIVCDGAKSSCAAKIASSVDAAIMGCSLAARKRVFQKGEGLVMDGVEETLRSVGRMGRVGMHSTDIEILNIMIGK
jgi:L-cysteine desulfidase